MKLKKLIAPKLILPYLLLFFIAKYAFGIISGYILKRPDITPHPIDVHVLECIRFFDYQYVEKAQQLGYDHANYFKFFFPLDLVFPFIYSLLFLSILQESYKRNYFKLATILIIIGAVLDYSENFSFATYLLTSYNFLAPPIAFFTTTKSIVFATNCIFAIISLYYILRNLLKKYLGKI